MEAAREFLLDSYKVLVTQFCTVTRVMSLLPGLPGATRIKLERTVFYPQGGGQPSDIGVIYSPLARFQVKAAETDKADDNVWHIGDFEGDARFAEGDEVTAAVDEPTRRLHARLHSGGHLIDMAVGLMGLALKPSKGVHFPGNCAVEYFGNIETAERDAVMTRLNDMMAQIERDTAEPVDVHTYTYEEAKAAIEMPDYLPAGRPVRYVRLAPTDKGSPCGGTHVKHVSEVGPIRITKIQKKGKSLRLSYEVSS